MRHGDKHRRFNMPKSQRRALFSNLTNALLMHEQINVTLPRAKELRTFADGMISYAKKGDLNSRRLALAFLRNNEVVSKLFSTLAERYKDRNGGYTRVIKAGFRYGDCAPMAIGRCRISRFFDVISFEKKRTEITGSFFYNKKTTG